MLIAPPQSKVVKHHPIPLQCTLHFWMCSAWQPCIEKMAAQSEFMVLPFSYVQGPVECQHPLDVKTFYPTILAGEPAYPIAHKDWILLHICGKMRKEKEEEFWELLKFNFHLDVTIDFAGLYVRELAINQPRANTGQISGMRLGRPGFKSLLSYKSQ